MDVSSKLLSLYMYWLQGFTNAIEKVYTKDYALFPKDLYALDFFFKELYHFPRKKIIVKKIEDIRKTIVLHFHTIMTEV